MQSEVNFPQVPAAKVALYSHHLLILQHFWQLHAGSDVRCAPVRVGADDFHPSHTHTHTHTHTDSKEQIICAQQSRTSPSHRSGWGEKSKSGVVDFKTRHLSANVLICCSDTCNWFNEDLLLKGIVHLNVSLHGGEKITSEFSSHGESFGVHKTFLKLHSKTALQHPPTRLKYWRGEHQI